MQTLYHDFSVFFLSISIQNIYLHYRTYETLQSQTDAVKDYVTIPVYALNRSPDGLEENCSNSCKELLL